jgi:hypothetical protein
MKNCEKNKFLSYKENLEKQKDEIILIILLTETSFTQIYF